MRSMLASTSFRPQVDTEWEGVAEAVPKPYRMISKFAITQRSRSHVVRVRTDMRDPIRSVSQRGCVSNEGDGIGEWLAHDGGSDREVQR